MNYMKVKYIKKIVYNYVQINIIYKKDLPQ